MYIINYINVDIKWKLLENLIIFLKKKVIHKAEQLNVNPTQQ